jgi:magnesium-transporting ATPase (P-type)
VTALVGVAPGLTGVEAARRLAVDGPNELRAAPPVPTWRRVLSQFQDPLIYLLLGAVAVSLVAWLLEGRVGLPVDVMVIGVVIAFNALLGFAQEARARNAVAALQKMTAVTSTVIRDGVPVRLPSDQLVCGDLLVLGEGDAVGADGVLNYAASLRVEESSLTGESGAVDKWVATESGEGLGDRPGLVFKGTAVVQGSGRAVVSATGMNTEMGSIATMLEATEEKRTPLQAEVSRIGRMLGIAVVIIAIVVVTTILIISDIREPSDVVTVLLLGVSLAVAAVPEGLPAILSVVLALGVQRMAVHRAIIKDLSSVETLGSASVIASDKTGTLTKSQMTIQQVVTASGTVTLTGVGYAAVGEVLEEGGPLTSGPLRAEQTILLGGGSLANNSSLRHVGPDWLVEGDPTEAAFLVAERKLGDEGRRQARFDRLEEIPFTSERKLMSSLEVDHDHRDQRVLLTKGAPDVLLELCDRLQLGHEVVELDTVRKQAVLEGVERLSGLALRTLSVAYRPLDDGEDTASSSGLEHGLIFVGTVGMIDPPRPEAAVAIDQAQRAGIRVIMITGDHPGTAGRIAEDLGIVASGARVMTGADLDLLPESELAGTIRDVSVYARVAPRHKLLIIAALQADGNIVAMTGDGVNDAPALKAADLGVAMGLTGTEVSKEAAKMVLADDNFATIVRAVREGRSIFDNIRKALRYLLSSNMGEVMTVFVGVVGAGMIGLTGQGEAVVLPLLATQILWINLVTDSAPALALGLDPETDDVMSRPPRRLTDRVIDGRMWGGVVFLGSVMAAATLLTIDLYLPGGLIAGTHDLGNARTAGFTVLVLGQLFNCLNSRSETSSVFRNLLVNRWLWGALVGSALLQVAVVNVGFLNTAFRTEPLSWAQWGVCVAIASSVLWADELRKVILRSRATRS